MKKSLIMMAALLASVAANAAGLAPMELAKQKNCLACHALDHKVVGPAYKDVAAKYAGDKGAAARLAAKIQAGGSGVWGPVPMPPNTTVNADEAKQLAAWVLTVK